MSATDDSRVTATSGIPRNGVFEAVLTSSRYYRNPCSDIEVRVQFISDSGIDRMVDAFWDGENIWRARFSPGETGLWRWRSDCSDRLNSGLHDRTGAFHCVPYEGTNLLDVHGPLRLSPNSRHLVHSDGTPFLWLADTAWNGVLKSEPRDWEQYLRARQSQGFTAVQFACTQWRGCDCDPCGDTAFTFPGELRINPDFFRRLDQKVAQINEFGIVASPALLWAVRRQDPGQALCGDDAIRLARYIVARWGAYNVLWILGADGRFSATHAERWRRIGRGVFGGKCDRPVTMLPRTRLWAGEEFRGEEWYSCIGYQSGHGDCRRSIGWHVKGPPATRWRAEPALPVINLEPCYEARPAYGSCRRFDAQGVRCALYRSLLVSPASGVTYGHCGIWPWSEEPCVPLNHPNTGPTPPWRESVHAEGAESVKHLRSLFSSIAWWDLYPDPRLVRRQPADPSRYVVSARNSEGSLALLYLPRGGRVDVNTVVLKRPSEARWFNPSTGEYVPAGLVEGERLSLEAPDQGDWVLIIGR